MAVIGLIAAAALAVTGWGLFTGSRSYLAGAVALVVTAVAGIGALHAWGETRSVPWTVGYLVAAALAATSAARQFAAPRPPEP